MSTTPAKKLELFVERVVMHMAFVVSALLLTYIDKIASDKKGASGH